LPSIFSLGLHALGITLVFALADAIRPEASAWFAGNPDIQYINLKASSGVLIWSPPAVPAAASSEQADARPASQILAHPSAGREMKPASTPSGPARMSDPSAGRYASVPAISEAGDHPWAPAPPETGTLAAVLGRLLDLAPVVRPGELRVVHPENGRFPMVLSRTTLPEDAPEALKGRTIYTVWLDVGTARQWLLHYSSTDPQVQMSGNVVRIAAVERIEAPYPQITIVPSGETGVGNNRLTITGILDSAGKLRGLKPAGASDEEASGRLMALLERWSFRPARKAGIPSDVAILLIVPRS
jgi:hypothetical protein